MVNSLVNSGAKCGVVFLRRYFLCVMVNSLVGSGAKRRDFFWPSCFCGFSAFFCVFLRFFFVFLRFLLLFFCCFPNTQCFTNVIFLNVSGRCYSAVFLRFFCVFFAFFLRFFAVFLRFFCGFSVVFLRFFCVFFLSGPAPLRHRLTQKIAGC